MLISLAYNVPFSCHLMISVVIQFTNWFGMLQICPKEVKFRGRGRVVSTIVRPHFVHVCVVTSTFTLYIIIILCVCVCVFTSCVEKHTNTQHSNVYSHNATTPKKGTLCFISCTSTTLLLAVSFRLLWIALAL